MVIDDDRPMVLQSLDEGVLTLTLNRGERFNPLSQAMIAGLDAALAAAARDDSIRAVVIAAAGRGFSAGHDLKEMRAHAADSATFALPGVNIGVFCSTPAVGVARNIGRKHAMEMLLTGAPVDAQTALAWGLVNRVVPIDGLDAAIREFTEVIKARSAATIRLGKHAFYAQIEQPIAAAYTTTGDVMAGNMALADASEGIDAFLGKRTPVWRGR